MAISAEIILSIFNNCNTKVYEIIELYFAKQSHKLKNKKQYIHQ